MKAQHTDEEPIDFDQYDPDARREFLDPQHKITKFTPIGGNNMLRWFKILMMMDNFADDPPPILLSLLLCKSYADTYVLPAQVQPAQQVSASLPRSPAGDKTNNAGLKLVLGNARMLHTPNKVSWTFIITLAEELAAIRYRPI